MQRLLVRSEDTTHSPIIPVLGYLVNSTLMAREECKDGNVLNCYRLFTSARELSQTEAAELRVLRELLT